MSPRAAPELLHGKVVGREWISSRLVRVALAGIGADRLPGLQPSSSVRVLLPEVEEPFRLDLPGWDGNRFTAPGGGRPRFRTLTPVVAAAAPDRISFDVVAAHDGAAARWAVSAPIGSPAALHGPARGWEPGSTAAPLVVAGDETAYAAVCQIAEAAGPEAPVTVLVEVGRPPLPPPPGRAAAAVEWIEADPDAPSQRLVERLLEIGVPSGGRVWLGGEAAAVQRYRRAVAEGLPADSVTTVVRGYWKYGRTDGEGSGD